MTMKQEQRSGGAVILAAAAGLMSAARAIYCWRTLPLPLA
jgi:hypothetical protein